MARDKYGILILMAADHFEFNETAMRIGHLGLITAREALLIISALGVILFELGAVDKPGRGPSLAGEPQEHGKNPADRLNKLQPFLCALYFWLHNSQRHLKFV